MYVPTSSTSARSSNLDDISYLASRIQPARDAMTVRHRASLRNTIHCRGIGLHSGQQVNLTLKPSGIGTGIRFRRTDLPDRPIIPALYSNVVDTRMSTVIGLLGRPDVRVATIEHLMAALHAHAITDICIDINGPETPVFDGSSSAFDFLIQCAGRQEIAAAPSVISVTRLVRVTGPNGAFAELRPQADAFSLSVSIDFPAKAIGFQHREMTLSKASFQKDICNSRTFVDIHEIEALQAAGLAKGGSLQNAVVVDGARVINSGGFRHHDECARHKILDAIGDIYLAGGLIEGQFIGYKCGHDINNRLLRELFSDALNWRLIAPQTQGNTPLNAVA